MTNLLFLSRQDASWPRLPSWEGATESDLAAARRLVTQRDLLPDAVRTVHSASAALHDSRSLNEVLVFDGYDPNNLLSLLFWWKRRIRGRHLSSEETEWPRDIFFQGGKTACQKYQPPSSATMVVLWERCRWLGFIVSFQFEAMKEIWSQWNGDRFRRSCCSRFIASTCWAGQDESLEPACTGSKMLLQQIEA